MDTTTATAKPAAEKVWTRRIIWSCKCGLVRAYDYTATARLQYVDKFGCAKYGEPRVTRLVDGVSRDVSHDCKCPGCGRDRKNARVTGVRTEHKCDARCMASKSGVCECSCGGKNHGSAHL